MVHITSHNAQGRSIIHSRSPTSWEFHSDGALGMNNLYSTSTFPVNLNNDQDIQTHSDLNQGGGFGVYKAGGTICRMLDIAPGSPPLMHRTHSLDIGIILEGEVEMELEDGGTTLLRRGDVFVQRGTMHAWRPPKVWLRMLCFLQPCEPVVVTGQALPEDMGLATGLLKPST